MIKTCPKCKIKKPEVAFFKCKANKSGLSVYCRACQSTYRQEYWKAHPGARAIAGKKWRITNPEKFKKCQRKHRLMKRYGLTETAFDEILARQNRCCLICEKKKRLVVDHCHATGKIRGLLCAPCNTALGAFNDSPSQLRKAAEYIENAKNENKKQ